MNKKKFKILFVISFFLFSVFLAGCTTTEERDTMSEPFNSHLTLLVSLPEKSLQDITFDLSAVNIVADDGTVREVMARPQRLNSYGMKGRQVFLAEKTLPDGRYRKLQLIVKDASVRKKGRVTRLALPAEGIEVNIDVFLKRNQGATIFLNWNVDASLHEGYLFKPGFTVKSQIPELSSMLIYVTNEGSNSVSVINRQSGKIAATVMVGKRPRGIATSTGGEYLKVYVANSGSNSISVIDPTSNKIENEIPIRFGTAPEAIAVGRVSSGKDLLFVANYASDTVSVVDATTYRELEKINVGRGPIAIAVDPPVERLTGTMSLSFEDMNVLRSYREKFLNVYVANHDSNNVSVLRIDTVAKTSIEVITLSVEWRPIAIYVDYPRGKVYIANYGSDNLSVIDIMQTVKGNSAGAVSSIDNVGFSIVSVIADPVFDRIYLLKERPAEIMIIRPFTGGFDSLRSIMPPVMGTIAVGTSPRSFILGPEGRKLYVVNTGSDNISVIDKTTKREEQVIPTGRKPYGIAVFPR